MYIIIGYQITGSAIPGNFYRIYNSILYYKVNPSVNRENGVASKFIPFSCKPGRNVL